MSDLRQLPILPDQPQSPDDINRHTPLRATLDLFRSHLLREGKSEHTVKAFTADLRLLAEYLGEDTPVGQFTTSGLNRFLDWLEVGRGVPCSRKSYARRVTTLKVYFRWLHGIGAIGHDPAKSVLQRSGPAPLSEVLSPEQIDATIDFSRSMKRRDEQDYRPELLLRLLLDTGIKKGETMHLTREHIDRTNPRSPMLVVKHKSRNVYKERRLQLDATWVDLLDLYLEQYSPEDTIFDCTARNLEYILSDIGEGAGIPFKVSFEVLRWTCAVRDFRDGMEPQRIREKLGLSETSWYETQGKIRKLAERLEMAGSAG